MAAAAHQPLPPTQRLVVTVGIMAATIMQVLDTTIANVALPHMQAALGANRETVSWVLTSYIVVSAITMPLTGWLSERFGRKTLTLVSIIGFTLASAACGVASNLGMMVAARAVQGLAGAFITPISQAVLYDINPPDRHAKAMTVWGMGVMIAPVAGPVLGGWITEQLDWRWVFFINVPIGIIAVLTTWAAMPSGRARAAPRFDMFGFVLLALGIAALQLMLDRGEQKDWFSSPEILIELGIAIAGLWMFTVHAATARTPLLPRAIFRDRNFVTALTVLTITAGVMVGGSALLPPMLQQLLGYGTTEAGLITAPRGVGMMISMMAAGRLNSRLDGRLMIAAGLSVIAVSLWMMTGFDLDMGREPIILAGLVQGLGFGFVVLPLNLLAFATLSPRLRTDAASLYSLGRSLGGSILISILTFVLARNVQVAHSDLASHIPENALPTLVDPAAGMLGVPVGTMLGLLDGEINRQALMVAYIDDYWLMFLITLACVPLALLMRQPGRPATAAAQPVAFE